MTFHSRLFIKLMSHVSLYIYIFFVMYLLFVFFKAVDSHSGFKSFLNENQIQSETRTFTIITRVNAFF